MNLRTRLTLTVAAIVAAAIIGGAYAARYSAAKELQNETDKFLLSRSDRFTHEPIGQEGSLGGPPPERDGGGLPLVDFDAVTQVIDGSGAVRESISNQPVLPIDARDRQLAAKGGGPRLRDVTVNDVHYRMLTAPIQGGGAVQIARTLTETDNVLAVLRDRLVLIGLAGTVLAALIAWAVARSTTAPIEHLTQASEYIAGTQDLTTPIAVTRNDEVGRLAMSFNTMLMALDNSREQQKRLVVDASHELRTPLTAVRTNIDFLARAGATLDAEERTRLLAETRLELDELTNLVGELVELATDVRTDEPVEAVDLGEIASEVAARFRRRTGRTLNLTVEEAGTVEGRRSMVDRAISNLVDNALKFSPADRAVDVSVEGGEIEVADRGPGVAEEDRSRVFDRFYRAPSTRSLPGSGLGLSIVKQIAELHGGTVSVGPREGGGTVARVQLPCFPRPVV